MNKKRIMWAVFSKEGTLLAIGSHKKTAIWNYEDALRDSGIFIDHKEKHGVYVAKCEVMELAMEKKR